MMAASVEEADWRLILVNPWNSLPENYYIPLAQSPRSDLMIDSRINDDLNAMLDDCRAAGYSPYICSAYRDWDTQVYLYEKQVEIWESRGYSEEEAEAGAATEVAVPGTSEHQLGLALDIVDSNMMILDDSQADTPTQQWLMEHCWEYGFILRYPEGKEDITGINYEPWHYRYVGREAAQYITENGITLEEYLGKSADNH
jgi:D-alanyl-D-alanine carboxypeptidase